MSDALDRAKNAVRRLLAGLPPQGAPPSPAAPTAVFRTLGSIYHFAAGPAGAPTGGVTGASVLDWGCGTGYGAAVLADAGARPVLGVDPSAAAVRYARRRFGGGPVAFRVAPLDDPLATSDRPAAAYDRIVAVGTLARLTDPERVVPRVITALAPDGTLIASLPPILDGPTLELYRARHPEAARLFLWDWADLLRGAFEELRLYGHQPPAGRRLDLASPRPSDLDEAAFRFDEVPLDDLDNVGTLGAVFVASSPKS